MELVRKAFYIVPSVVLYDPSCHQRVLNDFVRHARNVVLVASSVRFVERVLDVYGSVYPFQLCGSYTGFYVFLLGLL